MSAAEMLCPPSSQHVSAAPDFEQPIETMVRSRWTLQGFVQNGLLSFRKSLDVP
jgi:hypothetical protein